jgi:intracellular sulfur oxidation DsrE/DsrF family protein
MRNYKLALALCLLFGLISTRTTPAQANGKEVLHIDIPTKLTTSNIVIDYGHAAYIGDALFGLGDINLLVSELKKSAAVGQVTVIFHGDAAYLILNDETYNTNRHVATGNPFKTLLQELMSNGVHLELCGATAAGNHWGNADLLPGVKVNVNAMVRITQLEQAGYTLIYQ